MIRSRSRKSDQLRSSLGELAEAVGKGLFAGAVGTSAMTISSTIEMKLRGREPSSAPAEAAGKVLGVGPVDQRGRDRFANIVHWGYGTTWGAARGALDAAGVRRLKGTAAHFAAIWGGALIMLPSLGVTPPPWKWGAREVAIDGLHHAVYAVATGVAYEWLVA